MLALIFPGPPAPPSEHRQNSWNDRWLAVSYFRAVTSKNARECKRSSFPTSCRVALLGLKPQIRNSFIVSSNAIVHRTGKLNNVSEASLHATMSTLVLRHERHASTASRPMLSPPRRHCTVQPHPGTTQKAAAFRGTHDFFSTPPRRVGIIKPRPPACSTCRGKCRCKRRRTQLGPCTLSGHPGFWVL